MALWFSPPPVRDVSPCIGEFLVAPLISTYPGPWHTEDLYIPESHMYYSHAATKDLAY